MNPSDLARDARRQWTSIGLTLLLGGCATLPPHLPLAMTRSLSAPGGALEAAIRPPAGSPEGLSGFRLLPTPTHALDARHALADRAERSLDVQYYELRDDVTGLGLLRALEAAARRGVRVRLLVDDMHAGGEECLFWNMQRAGRLEVRLFNPFPVRSRSILLRFASSARDFRRLERRMHNKAFIADGALAIVGGRNIADDYFLRAADGNFLDLDLLVAGRLVADLSASFDAYWNSPRAYPVDLLAPPGCDVRAEPPAALPWSPPGADDLDPLGIPPVGAELGAGRLTLVWAPGEVIADSPAKIEPASPGKELQAGATPTVRSRLREHVARATSAVVATSPYLVPGKSGMALLGALRDRGVDVSLVTNSMAAIDEPFAFVGYARYRKRLLALGVELFELSPAKVAGSRSFHLGGLSSGRLHAKSAVIDRRTVFVGSMNLDPRSEGHNTEVGVFAQSETLARQLLKLVEVVKSQGGLRVRTDAGLDGDSETGAGQRFLLWLLDPFVPEDLL